MSQIPARARVLNEKGSVQTIRQMLMSITRRTVAAVLFALAITFVPRARAQTPDSTASPATQPPIARSAVIADSVRLPAVNTRRVWDVQSNGSSRRTGRGAIIGGVGGALLGAAAGGVIGGGFCDAADCSGDTREGILIGGGIGAAAGILIGALIGYVW